MTPVGFGRQRVLLLGLGGLLLGAIILSLAVAQVFVLDGYRRLERESLDKDLRRATAALKYELEKLDLLTATWDARFNFSVDLNSAYIEPALITESLVNGQINMLVYADLGGHLRYRQAVNLQTGERVAFSPGFALHLSPDSPLLQLDHQAGVLKLPEGFLLVAARTHRTGTLILARYMDAAFVQTLVGTTFLALDFFPLDDPRIPAGVDLTPQNPSAAYEVDENFLAGYTLVNDLYDQPALVARVTIPRDLYTRSSDTLVYFLSVLLVVCVAFVIVVTLIFTYHTHLHHTNTALEARVAARTQELSDALAAKSRILANISHDARTPLNVITLNVQMLQRVEHHPRSTPRLENILLSVNQLLGFFDNLVTEAHTTTLSLYETEFTPGQLLSSTLKPLRVLADVKGLNVVTDIDPTLPPLLVGDLNRLEQILANLFGNAVKFTAQGSITVRLLRPTPATWAMEVQDTGRGIAPEHQAHIFRPFWQADSSITREANRGVGLGLAVVQQLAARMDAEVVVQSTLNQGSTFTVIFPLKWVVEGDGDGVRVVG